MSEVAPSATQPFFNKNGLGQAILRIKADETLEKAVLRLRKEGWDIPDLSKLETGEDATGKFFKMKA